MSSAAAQRPTKKSKTIQKTAKRKTGTTNDMRYAPATVGALWGFPDGIGTTSSSSSVKSMHTDLCEETDASERGEVLRERDGDLVLDFARTGCCGEAPETERGGGSAWGSPCDIEERLAIGRPSLGARGGVVCFVCDTTGTFDELCALAGFSVRVAIADVLLSEFASVTLGVSLLDAISEATALDFVTVSSPSAEIDTALDFGTVISPSAERDTALDFGTAISPFAERDTALDFGATLSVVDVCDILGVAFAPPPSLTTFEFNSVTEVAGMVAFSVAAGVAAVGFGAGLALALAGFAYDGDFVVVAGATEAAVDVVVGATAAAVDVVVGVTAVAVGVVVGVTDATVGFVVGVTTVAAGVVVGVTEADVGFVVGVTAAAVDDVAVASVAALPPVTSVADDFDKLASGKADAGCIFVFFAFFSTALASSLHAMT